MALSPEVRKLLEKAGKLCARENGFTTPAEAYVTLIDNEAIQRANQENRGIDKPTDVLSFPLLNFVEGKPVLEAGDMDPGTGRAYLGEIMISAEKAAEQAEQYGHSLQRELCFLVVHGMLHLLGFDHETKDQEKDMFERQEAVLGLLGLRRGES